MYIEGFRFLYYKHCEGHQNWYKNLEISNLYHHTKFERNRSANVWMQANVIFIT